MTVLAYLNAAMQALSPALSPAKVYARSVFEDDPGPHATLTLVNDQAYITSDGEASSRPTLQLDCWHPVSLSGALALVEASERALSLAGYVRQRSQILGRDGDHYRITSQWERPRIPTHRE